MWPADRRYTISSVALWGGFLMMLPVLAWSSDGRWPAPALWALALAPAATVVVQFILAYRLIARQDEFVRALTAKRIIAAAGVAIAVAVGWSILEEYAGLFHVPAWLIYPLFWGALGMVTPFIRSTRA